MIGQQLCLLAGRVWFLGIVEKCGKMLTFSCTAIVHSSLWTEGSQLVASIWIEMAFFCVLFDRFMKVKPTANVC